jgi:3-hydroxyacyl-CoA dehydrogenase
VIGAGVMGGGIAAHFANAGLDVLLLDLPGLAQAGLEKTLKAKPAAAFFHPSFARLVRIGDTENDLKRLGGCDLVIEAIIEKVEPKQALFAKLEKIVAEHCIIASNTSGLRIADMTKGRSESFRKRFIVMHFFNPVRYMKLLELVCGPDTAPETLGRIRKLGEDVLGKGIVVGKDTPNFVGNRIGAHAMLLTMHEMLAQKLAPEDIDAITGLPMAHPKSASFRTADLVGLDTLVHVADNCHASLYQDEDRAVFEVPAFVRGMLEKKLLGDKTKGGFFKKIGGDIQTFDPYTQAYRPKGGNVAIKEATKTIAKVDDPKERLRRLIADKGATGAFAWKVLSRSLAYSARRIGEIVDDVASVDDAMRWGYNWELGPFEAWDALGFDETVARMEKDGIALPESIRAMKAAGARAFYDGDKVFDLVRGAYVARKVDPRNATFQILSRGAAPVLKNDGAEARDLGDGVLGLRFKTKANTIDPDVIAMLHMSVERAERDFRAMVLTNDGDDFCMGANLFLVGMTAGQKQWDQLRDMVQALQSAIQRMRYARVPVIVAPFGRSLGGGLELCFGGTVQAAAETYAGLVEVGAGLIPGGGGHMHLLWRALEAVPDGAHANVFELAAQIFKNIALVRIATSADEAKHFGYFRRTDGVTFDRARQLTEAKARAIGLAESGWHPPAPRAFVLPGENGMATLELLITSTLQGGQITQHDALIARKVAKVLCGGPSGASHEVTEDEMLELEREEFVSLCGEPKSLERMQYMVQNKRPLRN